MWIMLLAVLIWYVLVWILRVVMGEPITLEFAGTYVSGVERRDCYVPNLIPS